MMAAAPRPHATHGSPDARASSAAFTKFDGLYAGPVCFAETKKEPHRCFRQSGTIAGRKITGQWFMGPEKKIVMVLDGDVTKSGDVVIEMVMHSGTAQGERLGSVSLQGTLRDGVLDTTGTWRNGRPATLNWRKESRPESSH